jgi:hypothetical protein
MSFTNPNIYFTNSGFWIRWTLIVFIFINIILLIYLLIRGLWVKSIAFTHNTKKTFLFPSLIYLSTIPIYYFRNVIGDKGNSVIYRSAESLNSLESLVVITMIIALIYGLTFKNSYTFVNLYCKVLAALELTYIFSCYITSQVELNSWFNQVGVILLGIIFVTLNVIKIKPTQKKIPQINFHNATTGYTSLFSSRKYQAKELVSIIESSSSESGYSVCVTGKWGMGKTSLANGVLDKVRKNQNVDIHEIRINAMELEDELALVNYFFKRIENILKSNNTYVGIASEYKELIASIAGTIVNKSASNFISRIMNKGNTDYRENIEKLSKLLSENLVNARILIVIDDLERCSGEKAKTYLLLMKEIATMHQCVTLFLVDIDKLKSACDLDDLFLEKFFNYTISLATVDSDELFFRLTEEESPDLSQEIKKMFEKFDEEIDKAEKERFLYIQDHEKREEYKEMRINTIKENKERFSNDLENPRSVWKVIECYKRLSQQVAQQIIDCPSAKRESVELFLNKVDHKKQLAIISVICGLYNSEFMVIQSNGIYNYIGEFSSRLRLAKNPEEKIYRVDSLLEGKWYDLLRQLSSDFNIQEILRFVNCVLTNIKELPNISNGYNSIEERNISIIKNGFLPNDITFPELVSMIYSATYKNFPERENLVKSIFNLYDRDYCTNSIDEAFDLFSNGIAYNAFSSEIPVLHMFLNIFCTDNRLLIKPEKAIHSFNSFADGYLWRNATILSRYFMPISQVDKVSVEMWNNANERVLVQESCENKLKAYCEACESHLAFSDENPDACSIMRVDRIISKVDTKYIELDMSESFDVLQARENVVKLMDEIKCLFEIERFINKCMETAEQSSFNIRELSSNTLSVTVDKLNSEFCESIEYNDIQILLQFICGNEQTISPDEYEKLSGIIDKYYKMHGGGIASWRQMLICIKTNKVKVQDVVPGRAKD